MRNVRAETGAQEKIGYDGFEFRDFVKVYGRTDESNVTFIHSSFILENTSSSNRHEY